MEATAHCFQERLRPCVCYSDRDLSGNSAFLFKELITSFIMK
jgi:hypothetical protein